MSNLPDGSSTQQRVGAERIVVVFFVLLMLALSAAQSAAGQQGKSYNVVDFHAAGDGNTVIQSDMERNLQRQQFADHAHPWRKDILAERDQLDGGIVAPNAIWTTTAANLLTFYSVGNLTVEGSGQIDGNGAIWWACFKQKLLSFSSCNNLLVRNIHLKDSPDKHMTLHRCSQVNVYNVSVTAPGDSPNTDGISMSISDHVYISSCSIQSGDDCVSILSGTTDVNITDNTCGPGHGIRYKCTTMSMQGGKGSANGFLFENLKMNEVQHPIDIDQFYCPPGNCQPQDGAVAISDARFINIQGISSDPEAIKIMCSKSVQCRGIYLDNVNLSCSRHTAQTRATILNAYGTIAGMVKPEVRFLGT
ncbi:hypothetical protein ACQ4PT_034501 [Festuca glaucescens]